MYNTEIRKAAKEANIKLYELAEYLHVSEFTFSRRLRKEFSEEQKQDVLKAISKIVTERENEDND